MDEASKTRALWGKDVLSLMTGDGLDIGCGPDPIFPNVDRFDKEDGDANVISKHINKKYDFVFSSHCLEHMHDPKAAIKEWYSLVKPGGHLITLVPDEDLYEQGFFPSIFNEDHKHTFTIKKDESWSPRSINVMDIAKEVDGELVSVELQDQGYEKKWKLKKPSRYARRLGKWFNKLRNRRYFKDREKKLASVLSKLGGVIDQTSMNDSRLAQIQFIIRKPL